ncbi:hypothetical protein BD779DRAFT_1623344 [Infundibulicybe gibba]|nr:hypothetical protein BD779DRAFT_1623344 [Infundibulicybe gibba]
MDSSSHRKEEELREQEELRKQIALLQARLIDRPETHNLVPTSPKRKRADATLLVPATPSPKKRKMNNHQSKAKLGGKSSESWSSAKTQQASIQRANKPSNKELSLKPAPSTFLNQLANIQSRPVESVAEAVKRSTAFTDTPQHGSVDGPQEISFLKRDDRLALIEDLEPGPVEHKVLDNDPDFKTIEPNSGIRLASRTLPHEDLQEYLRGRYYLSPSQLYSSIRLLPDRQGYDVPVPGDWITIAVVAERGPAKFTRAPVNIGMDAGMGGAKGKGKGRETQPDKPSGKRYVNIKLVDFGVRSSASGSTQKAIIRGDAHLTLLLFESDGFDVITEEGGPRKGKKVYKGGSRGAYEAMSKLKEGDVIALLNLKILKPFQRSTDSPHPTNNILAITPESASSIIAIGRSRDLGLCHVVKKDGKVCGSWCDKRVSEVCEWHVQNAVERRRAARPEFSIGTSGMSTTAAPKRKPAYDPSRQWGLKPTEPEVDGATYVVSGHIVSGSANDPNTLHISETIGREGQARARRRTAGQNADRTLKALLERDKEGMKAVIKAREVGMEGKEEQKEKLGKRKPNPAGNGKTKVADLSNENESADEAPAINTAEIQLAKHSYPAAVIKKLGFDPTLKFGQKQNNGDSAMQTKLKALAAVQSSRKVIALGPRPGERVRSGVVSVSQRKTTGSTSTPGALEESGVSSATSGGSGVPVLATSGPGLVDLDDL